MKILCPRDHEAGRFYCPLQIQFSLERPWHLVFRGVTEGTES